MNKTPVDTGVFYCPHYDNGMITHEAQETSNPPKPEEFVETVEQRDKRLAIVEHVYEEWKDSPYLEGIPEDRKRTVAVLLDNQKLFMAACTYVPEDGKPALSEYVDLFLNIIHKTFLDFVGFEIAPIHAMAGPTDAFDLLRYKVNKESDPVSVDLRLESEQLVARTRRIASSLKGYDGESVAQFVLDLRDEIAREMLRDIYNNCGTVTEVKFEDLTEIYLKIHSVSDCIFRKTLRSLANWVVVGPDVAKKLIQYQGMKPSVNLDEIKHITKIETFCHKWKIIVDPQMSADRIVVGTLQEKADCYNYAPYVFLSPTPPNEENTVRFLMRYGKKLSGQGSKAYGRISATK